NHYREDRALPDRQERIQESLSNSARSQPTRRSRGCSAREPRAGDGDLRGQLEHDRDGRPDDIGIHRRLRRVKWPRSLQQEIIAQVLRPTLLAQPEKFLSSPFLPEYLC